MASASLLRSAAATPLAVARDLILPVALVASVLVIVVPLPGWLMDILLSANIAIAVIMLLTTTSVRTPLEFSVFPSLLLATTLFRLVLNVATTRLILTRAGTAGVSAAGEVVRSFGEFVAGNNVVVGLVLFAIIVVIQFVVITKGATRIGEVAARFALDGMPGRQMAVDADLNAGLIDQREAQRRRQEITRQADFFGAMDGASKFVRGDAVAAILITLINIGGGLAIGVFSMGMSPGRAAEVFTKLTIGDGLVTQIPAFLISLAAALLVTRSNQETDLPREFLRQLFARPQALAVAAGFLGVLIFARLPAVPLLALGAGCTGLAVMLSRQRAAAAEEEKKAKAPARQTPRVEDFLRIDPLEIELGLGLIRLADTSHGGDLLERIQRVRQTVAAEIGIVMPKVRIRDNLRLQPQQYRIRFADVPAAESNLPQGMLLAVGHGADELPGDLAAADFDAPARWIAPAERSRAEAAGCRVFDPPAAVAAHLAAVIRLRADELLTRDAVKHLLDELRKESPAVVDELVPRAMKLGEVQQVLHLLLREQVPIRQLGTILEALGDHAGRSSDAIALAEAVRARLARTISTRYADRQQRLHVVTLDPAWEERIQGACELSGQGFAVGLAPAEIAELSAAIARQTRRLQHSGRPPLLLVGAAVRPIVKQLTAAELPQLVVLAYNEIVRDVKVQAVAMVATEEETIGAGR